MSSGQRGIGDGNGNRVGVAAAEVMTPEQRRQQAIQRLQANYNTDAATQAKKQAAKDEQKRLARLVELEELTKNMSTFSGDGHRLGTS